jgi:hypothetical protein
VAASQAGQEVVYLRALLRCFGYPQREATEIWEDNASCLMMRDLVRDGHIKLVKCAGTHNVSDALTKSLPQPFRNIGSIWLVLRYLSRLLC